MRRRALLGAGGALLFAGAGAAQAAPALGEVAPDFTLPDATGRTVRLADLRGRLVVLQWINPGCPFLKKHYASGSLVALQRETVARGVQWLLVESNRPDTRDYFEPAELLDWLRGHRSPAQAVLMDDTSRVARAFGARTASHSYLLAADGRLLYAGAVDSIPSTRAEDIPRAVPHLRNALMAALAGEPAPVGLSRPYGCNLMLAGA
jgi:hypothetical protein